MSDEKFEYKRKCVVTGEEYSVIVNLNDLLKYNAGQGLAQQLFHYLDAGDREFIISGISPKGWKETFG